MQSPILPSPLCDKELEDLIFRVGRSQVNDGETLHSAANGEVGGELKMNSQLPNWTSSAILTNKVQYLFHIVGLFVTSKVFCDECMKKTWYQIAYEKF